MYICCVADLILFSPASQSDTLPHAVRMADSPDVVVSISPIDDEVLWITLLHHISLQKHFDDSARK